MLGIRFGPRDLRSPKKGFLGQRTGVICVSAVVRKLRNVSFAPSPQKLPSSLVLDYLELGYRLDVICLLVISLYRLARVVNERTDGFNFHRFGTVIAHKKSPVYTSFEVTKLLFV